MNFTYTPIQNVWFRSKSVVTFGLNFDVSTNKLCCFYGKKTWHSSIASKIGIELGFKDQTKYIA